MKCPACYHEVKSSTEAIGGHYPANRFCIYCPAELYPDDNREWFIKIRKNKKQWLKDLAKAKQ